MVQAQTLYLTQNSENNIIFHQNFATYITSTRVLAMKKSRRLDKIHTDTTVVASHVDLRIN